MKALCCMEPQASSAMRTPYTLSPIATSACTPSPISGRKTPARSFQRTCRRQVGVIATVTGAARRELRWLALRGSPAGSRCRPDTSQIPSLGGQL